MRMPKYRGYVVREYQGYSQERINEQARVCSMPPEERMAYYAAQAHEKAMEEEKLAAEERAQTMNLIVDRLKRAGYPIISAKCGVVTIDLNLLTSE
jgi:hypothetical protein